MLFRSEVQSISQAKRIMVHGTRHETCSGLEIDEPLGVHTGTSHSQSGHVHTRSTPSTAPGPRLDPLEKRGGCEEDLIVCGHQMSMTAIPWSPKKKAGRPGSQLDQLTGWTIIPARSRYLHS